MWSFGLVSSCWVCGSVIVVGVGVVVMVCISCFLVFWFWLIMLFRCSVVVIVSACFGVGGFILFFGCLPAVGYLLLLLGGLF